MCGVCGIYRFDTAAVTEDQVLGMMAKLQHRGPDDQGTYVCRNVGLGHRRLSILDLSPRGRQPFRSADGRYYIIHNGEVYNYLELRDELEPEFQFRTDTDTEVILCAFQKWGEAALERFNGMFAFVIYDTLLQSVFGARDRYGIKPFYYLANDKFFAFASEIPALLTLLPAKPSPHYQAVFDYLAWNRTDHTDETFFADIRKVPHGHTVRVSEQSVHVSRWYSLRNRLRRPWDSPDEFRATLDDAVKLRLRSDVPVGVSLSGGLDSSSILALAIEHQRPRDRQTFSAVYGSGNTGDESAFIAEFKEHVGSMHFANPTGDSLLEDSRDFVRAQGEPVSSCGPYAQFKVMESASGRVVVLLDGQGADEQLAGYHYFFGYLFRDLVKSGKLASLTGQVLHYLRAHRSLFGLQSLAFLLAPSNLQTSVRARQRGCMDRDFANQYSAHSRVSQLLYKSKSLNDALLDHFECKLEHLLKWQDRSSMWFSLESRVPFLDHRLVERTLSLPAARLIDRGETKKILRLAMRGILPEKIRQRKDKIGFGTPAAQWFMSPAWSAALDDLILSGSFDNRAIMDARKVAARRATWDRRGVCDAQETWKWINLELWFREFID